MFVTVVFLYIVSCIFMKVELRELQSLLVFTVIVFKCIVFGVVQHIHRVKLTCVQTLVDVIGVEGVMKLVG